jgi:hypothetical protein
MKEQEGRELLLRLAEIAGRQRLPGSKTALPWAKKAAKAIKWYLDGRVSSLDVAFGQKRGQGRKPNPDRRAKIARQAIAMRSQGKTYDEIKIALEARGIHLDESVIRDYVDEHRPKSPDVVLIAAHAEDLVRDLKRGK